jgi:hypothetical protein
MFFIIEATHISYQISECIPIREYKNRDGKISIPVKSILLRAIRGQAL